MSEPGLYVEHLIIYVLQCAIGITSLLWIGFNNIIQGTLACKDLDLNRTSNNANMGSGKTKSLLSLSFYHCKIGITIVLIVSMIFKDYMSSSSSSSLSFAKFWQPLLNHLTLTTSYFAFQKCGCKVRVCSQKVQNQPAGISWDDRQRADKRWSKFSVALAA